MLGAAIVLPDHPQIAPESRGNLFDGTEIEEALLLHVHALCDAEREEIAAQDPAVREMVERAAATTPEDLIALHGDAADEPTRRGPARRPTARDAAPSPPSASGGDAEIDRRRRHLPPGDKVVLARRTAATRTTGCSTARTATIERILHRRTTTASTSA